MKISKKNLRLIIENFLFESDDSERETAEDRQKNSQEMTDMIFKGFKSARKQHKKEEMLNNMKDYGMFTNPEALSSSGQFGISFDDYMSPKGIESKDLRRKTKITWNENADHDFFKNKIAKLHQLGYAGGFGKDTLSTRYLTGGGKTELSVWGIKSSSPLKPSLKEFYAVANPNNYEQSFDSFYIVLDGRVTWAGDFDAYTEELGTHRTRPGSEDDQIRQKAIEITASSGIPKRPGGLNLFDDMAENLEKFPILLDEEDVDALPNPLIDEMVVDNWNIVSLTYFTSEPLTSLKDKSIDDLASWCNNIKQSRGKNSPYHKLKIAVEQGFPNPRVCDYLIQRYWTDSEIQEMFSKLS